MAQVLSWGNVMNEGGMRQGRVPATIITFLLLGVGLQGCHFFGLGPSMPDLGGAYLARNAEINADKKPAKEIISAFKQAEEAVFLGDIDGAMKLYAKSYRNRGFNEVMLRSAWKNLFQEYRDLSITHVFSRIMVQADTIPPKAQVTCTGTLWGISKQTGRRVNIDHWVEEVYYLVYENSGWRTQGHAWEVLMDKDTRAVSPPHPFF
jgi:hypothetical protein